MEIVKNPDIVISKFPFFIEFTLILLPDDTLTPAIEFNCLKMNDFITLDQLAFYVAQKIGLEGSKYG